MTFSGKHQQQHQHLEEVPEGIPHDQIQAPDPTEKTMLSHLNNQRKRTGQSILSSTKLHPIRNKNQYLQETKATQLFVLNSFMNKTSYQI